MKVLLLADVPGWIIDRVTDRMIEGIPAEFTKGYFCCMDTAQLLNAAQDCDLIHYGNWDIGHHWPAILQAGRPIVMSVRSHRFPPYVREVARQVHVHVVNRGLLSEFPRGTYIPDGIMVEPQPLRVGFAGKPGPYKGTDLIEQACREIGAEYCPANGDLDWSQMRAWFHGIDVYCCASEAEGFSTPVLEALAMNKPVVSVRVGLPYFEYLPGITWTDRNIESIKEALVRHWPAYHLEPYTWPRVCEQFRALYERLAA